MTSTHSPARYSAHVDDARLGRVVSVSGSKAVLELAEQSGSNSGDRGAEMGSLLAIDTPHAIVLAVAFALRLAPPNSGAPGESLVVADVSFVGELSKAHGRLDWVFSRGVVTYPAIGDPVRLATAAELEIAFRGDAGASVRVGSIHQDRSIPATIRVDDLLGKHFAVLGTTGTGKSCTTALILHAVIRQNPHAHIVLLDPHNEYAPAFKDRAEVINPRSMQLPFWLLTLEELLEVLVGPRATTAEADILQELIPIAKARYTGRARDTLSTHRALDPARFTADTPMPYRISDLVSLIDERMGRLDNRKDLGLFRALKLRFEALSQDTRFSFMFGSLTVFDGMTQVLGRLFRIPTNGKPVTIVELTGIPAEIVSVVVSVICRMAFDFVVWSEGRIPVTIVCEEAHRYVPANADAGFEPCRRAIAKIAKEGRKYGASLCIVTQRPAEIDPTILSQCNTVFALRLANARDQDIIRSAVADTGVSLLEFLPSLGHREAIAFGEGVALPVRIRFDQLPDDLLPRSSTASFSEKWTADAPEDGFLASVVDRWRSSGHDRNVANSVPGTAALAEAVMTPWEPHPAVSADDTAPVAPAAGGPHGVERRQRTATPPNRAESAVFDHAVAAPSREAQVADTLKALRNRLTRPNA